MDQTQAKESKALKDAEWLAAKVAHIRGLKAPSEQQKLFATLVELTQRTPMQQRQFVAFIKAAKLEDRAAAARAASHKLVAAVSKAESAAARKARTKHLIELGGLVVKAGISNWTNEELLGMFIAASTANEEKKANWATRGAEVFAETKKTVSA